MFYEAVKSMKFEDLLMQPSEEKQKVKDLEEEVVVGKRCTSGFVWSYTESSIRFVSVLPSSLLLYSGGKTAARARWGATTTESPAMCLATTISFSSICFLLSSTQGKNPRLLHISHC